MYLRVLNVQRLILKAEDEYPPPHLVRFVEQAPHRRESHGAQSSKLQHSIGNHISGGQISTSWR